MHYISGQNLNALYYRMEGVVWLLILFCQATFMIFLLGVLYSTREH